MGVAFQIDNKSSILPISSCFVLTLYVQVNNFFQSYRGGSPLFEPVLSRAKVSCSRTKRNAFSEA